MSDMIDLVATINTKVLAAIEAEEGGDCARALQLLQQAQMALSVVPDGRLEEESVAWDREAINAAVGNLRRRTAAASGVITEEITYARG